MKLNKVLTILGFTSALTVVSAFGQAGGPAISFDEWGNATGMGPGIVTAADPSGGVGGPVLVYALPFGVMSGDVLLSEPTTTGTQEPSDVIRFWNPTGNPNQSLIIFYSDRPGANEIEVPPPADVGLPLQFLPFVVGPFAELGTEAANGYVYTALPGMPGGALPGTALPPVTYSIVSDGVVPEPSTASLAILAGGLALFLKQRWQLRRG